MKNLCHSCQQKTITFNTHLNIWDFNPFIYESFKEMKDGFKKFYGKLYDPNNEKIFYSCYNEEGYTYSQWYVYIISKNLYKYKNLKKKTLWAFQVFSGYDFFHRLIKIGKIDDKLHNTLHHFLKYLDKLGKIESLTLELLLNNGLKMDQVDNEGYCGNDYLTQKSLSEEDLLITKLITSEYKKYEDELYSHFFFSRFNRCDMCNDFTNKYEDILQYRDDLKHFKDLLYKIEEIIKKRLDCINIYAKYDNCVKSTERHIYVVNVYKTLLSS